MEKSNVESTVITPSAPARPIGFEKDAILTEIVRRLVAAYQPERIYLFGSRARGDAGPDSDYDLLVVVPVDATPLRQNSHLAYEVLWGTGTATDVVVMNHGYYAWTLGATASLSSTVEREGHLLYAA